ncbi:hypothetical protein BS47DRAFT_1335667 [Hydnum rufescens UP504]|uniref:Secreted protein n=1 Tax=Hydnum rufescens UP504 TaxID=1448309 RepID=A0A9P6BAL5_9AGAM|nr:hypothetical protein BS47DRAFT_1335667 [Hydnum rufescens UP504]
MDCLFLCCSCVSILFRLFLSLANRRSYDNLQPYAACSSTCEHLFPYPDLLTALSTPFDILERRKFHIPPDDTFPPVKPSVFCRGTYNMSIRSRLH